MTMQLLSVVKASINSTMPDNNTGQITPAILRANLQDMVDSLYYRSAALIGDHTAVPLAQALTTVPTNYPNVYTTALETDPTVVDADLVAGSVVPLVTGFICEALLSFTCNGANGRIVTANLEKNGVIQQRFKIAATMSGAGNFETASVALPLIGITSGDIFKMLLSVDTNASITFSGASLVFRVIPTFSAV